MYHRRWRILLFSGDAMKILHVDNFYPCRELLGRGLDFYGFIRDFRLSSLFRNLRQLEQLRV